MDQMMLNIQLRSVIFLIHVSIETAENLWKQCKLERFKLCVFQNRGRNVLVFAITKAWKNRLRETSFKNTSKRTFTFMSAWFWFQIHVAPVHVATRLDKVKIRNKSTVSDLVMWNHIKYFGRKLYDAWKVSDRVKCVERRSQWKQI